MTGSWRRRTISRPSRRLRQRRGRHGRDVDGDGAVTVDFASGPAEVKGKALADLVHGWAITVHRAQGSEFPAVVVVLPPEAGGMLSRPLVYTALTRAQRHLSIVHAAGPGGAPGGARRSARSRGGPGSIALLRENVPQCRSSEPSGPSRTVEPVMVLAGPIALNGSRGRRANPTGSTRRCASRPTSRG